MEKTCQVLERLKLSHADNLKTIARRNPGHENLRSLDAYFKYCIA